MGKFAEVFFGITPKSSATVQETNPKFAVDAQSIPAQVFGLESYQSVFAPEPRISRREAMQLPAVKRCRELVAGALGGLPLVVIDTDRITRVNDLLDNPERGIPRSVTMAWTIENLIFEGVAYWHVTERGFDQYPRWVKRVDPSRVDVNADTGVVRVDGKKVNPADVIQFHSPNDPLLVAGSRAIRTALRLDAAAARYSEGAPPLDYFRPAEGADPADDEDIVALLDQWKTARQSRSTGYVPASLVYEVGGWNPEQLQMAEARQHATLEIARLAGVDPEELGVSTTSRTYQNGETRRQWFIDMCLGPYAHAIEDRLSLGDVTKRGYLVRFDFDDFMRTDALTRYQAYKIGLEVGAIDRDEIRAAENKPPLALAPQPEAVPSSVPSPAAALTASATFDEAEIGLRLDAQSGGTFSVDTESRIISGLAVPYGVHAKADGRSWQFAKGVLQFEDVGRVKLLVGHDWKQAVGKSVALEETDAGLMAIFKVARGPEGDRALSMAADGVWDGLSVGLGDPSLIKFTERDGIAFATSAPLAEISLTPCPAFGTARVTSVAAASDLTKEPHMTDVTTEPVVEQPVNMSAVTEAIAKGFETLRVDGPLLVQPTTPTFEVNEPAPYRFDGVRGEHDFSTDLITGLRDNDSEAMTRVLTFMQDAFAPTFDIDSGNVTTLNPVRQRPDMYVDERRFNTPLYSALNKGAISDMTPFVFPRFDSASGLVADHVEGVEPTPGAFAATNQTVTPSAVSGKVEITREVWDQGGSPQVSGLIWAKMVQHYYSALEAKAYALLNGLTLTGKEVTVTTGAADDDLVNEVEGAIVDLNFVAGGNTFDYAATHANLYKRLAAAVDASGRKLLPQYGATNANGQSRSKFVSLDVAGVDFTPVPSLGAASNNNGNSYLLDTSSVHLWSSTPQRLEFQYRVAYVDLGIWGYVATAVSDLNGVRRIKYDPVA